VSFRRWALGPAVSAMLVAAAILFATPLARAILAAPGLDNEFSRGLGKLAPAHQVMHRVDPYSWRDLLLGIRYTKVTPVAMAYARRPEGDLLLDFYPASRAQAPCVVVVHGGGWNGGGRGDLAQLNSYLAGIGYAVVSIDYRLAPAHPYPAPVEDLKAAIAYLRAHAGELNIDPARLVLLGRSAGGQIAQQAAYTLKDRGIRGVIAFYSPADMVFGYRLPVNPLLLDSRKLMDDYLPGLTGDAARFAATSPIEAVDAQSPPTLMLHGRADVLVAFQHSTHLADRLEQKRVEHFLVDLPWAAHGFDYFFSGPGSQVGLYFMERFLAAVTK
jgi:acetyl esterase/lipase